MICLKLKESWEVIVAQYEYDWGSCVIKKLFGFCVCLFFNFPQGIAVGHVYFFLEDVFPNQPGGGRWLKTPSIM